jgi:murein L,D-transpeptidase YcbB/YkuD
MKKLYPALIFLSAFMIIISCKQKQVEPKRELALHLQGSINRAGNISFDSTAIANFFKTYTGLAKFENNVALIYRKQKFHHIWFDQNGILEFAQSLYGKVKTISTEGVYREFRYKNEIEGIFEDNIENTLSKVDTELMITCMFLYYTENVYKGIDDENHAAIEWLLPRKEISYEALLDSALLKPDLLTRNDPALFEQYYKLRNELQRFREIQKNGGWDSIVFNPKVKAYNPGDSANAIVQIRERLFATGDIAQNNGSGKYDSELEAAVQKYQLLNGQKASAKITPQLVKKMNVPVEELIKKIVVNMERCRWISPEMVYAKEYVFVNIPAYELVLIRNGERELESDVMVGKSMSKTVVFSGNISFIVFSPYWNVPTSILNSEVLPGIKKDKNYLEKHDMEWYNGQVRQKPGKKNSLGLVKFIFPNSNNIYLHDTPSKNLFGRDNRALSHGCVRVAKPKELAIELLKDAPEWTPESITAAMNAGKEKWVPLKNKVPVYIGYFTAWVDRKGEINFYDDVYELDERLYEILVNN